MTFRYEYNPEDQLRSDAPKNILLSEGNALFRIEDVYLTDRNGNDLTTKDGTPKIGFRLRCTDCRGNQGYITDYISAKMGWKFLSLGKSIGRKIYNESGTTNWENLKGLTGNCIVENQNNPGYEPRSTIKKYLPLPERKEPEATIKDDDLPF